MHAGREALTARVVTLMTPDEKSSLETKARSANLSVGEFVRRSVYAYDPEEVAQFEEFAALAREFRLSMEKASQTVDRANARIERTLNALTDETQA